MYIYSHRKFKTTTKLVNKTNIFVTFNTKNTAENIFDMQQKWTNIIKVGYTGYSAKYSPINTQDKHVEMFTLKI
jgi:hypothetical protein